MISQKISKLINKPYFELTSLGAIFILLQACGLAVPTSGWGLDQSWVWMTEKAAQSFSYGHGTYIWTYGPLSFLDYQQNSWLIGLVCQFAFRITAGLIFFYTFINMTNNRLANQRWLASLLAVVGTTFFYSFNTPSIMLMAALYIFSLSTNTLRKSVLESKYIIYFLSLVSAFQFYTKVLQFIVAGIISVALITSTKQKLENIRNYLLATSGLIIATGAGLHFTLRTFLLYLRGSYELTVGYKAMAIEDHSRILEYPAIIVLLIFLFYKIWKSSLPFPGKISMVATNLLFFEYGFTRHDGHSIYSFMWVGLSFLIVLSGNFTRSRKGMVLSTSLSIVFMLIVSQYSILGLLDFTPRVQQSINALKNLTNTNHDSLDQQDLNALRQNANVPETMLSEIGQSSLSILPVNQLVAKAYSLNLSQPPVPQLYSAYTPWLDQVNANFYSSQEKPKFLLEETPSAIDGRNPFWEAPRTQLGILCNYIPVSSSERWLLLTARNNSICGATTDSHKIDALSSLKGNPNSQNIYLFSYTRQEGFLTKILRIIFKPIHHDLITTQNESWNVVSKNNRNLILSVPRTLDFPGPWSFNQHQEINLGKGYKFENATLNTSR